MSVFSKPYTSILSENGLENDKIKVYAKNDAQNIYYVK
jgi:hypothetical protein